MIQFDPDPASSATPAETEETKPDRWESWRRRAWYVGLLGVGILAALLGLFAYNALNPPPAPLSQRDVEQSIAQAMASATPQPPYSAGVYQFILPSLVYIETSRLSARGEEGVGVGSGVVVNAEGAILTAYHVVANANEIRIFFADGTRTTAEIVAADVPNDIAVLQPAQPPEIIVPAVLGSVAQMRIGDEAYAVGNPLGLTGSLSAGVISGFDRSLPINEELRLEGLIQFDAAVNPGNSGGPLLNRAGQVIGIVTALVNPQNQDSFTGIGFAVPIGTAVSATGSTPQY
jgi:S1-C subfamily serine protease